MNIVETDIAGVRILEPQVFGDARGWFSETYNAARYRAAGITADFVQDNESFSSKGVVRGLHWQAAPHTQAKLVRVIRGAVWDVAVDIRKGSPTFGRQGGVRRGVRASGSYQEGTGKSGCFAMWTHPRGHVWNVVVSPASS